MARLTYSGEDDEEEANDGLFHDAASGEFVAPGETLDVPDDEVDAYLNHEHATFERASDSEGGADYEVEQSASDAPFTPGDYSVEELREELDRRDLSEEELDALEASERSDSDPRSTALEAINDQREG